MKNGKVRLPDTAAKVTVSTGTVDSFFRRSRDRARKLDRGEKLAPRVTLTFEDPADFARLLSPARVRVLHAVRVKPAAVSELAKTLKRDRKAIRRDVSVLESFGLISIREEPNPGHGRRRIILPLAEEYRLVTSI
jgi:predicted transcriptional regulator